MAEDPLEIPAFLRRSPEERDAAWKEQPPRAAKPFEKKLHGRIVGSTDGEMGTEHSEE